MAEDKRREFDIACRVSVGETLESVGSDYGITRERARQIYRRSKYFMAGQAVASIIREIRDFRRKITGEGVGIGRGNSRVPPLQGSEITDWILNQSGKIRAKDIAGATGCTVGTARTNLCILRKQGRIIRLTHGVYCSQPWSEAPQFMRGVEVEA